MRMSYLRNCQCINHEGVGEVVFDSKGVFNKGTKVVMVPNTPTEKDDVIAENYLKSSYFRIKWT